MDSSSQIEGSSSTTSTRRALPSGRVSCAREVDAEVVVVMPRLCAAILRVPCAQNRNTLGGTGPVAVVPPEGGAPRVPPQLRLRGFDHSRFDQGQDDDAEDDPVDDERGEA